jgi:Family of unknown function (DUF6518)
MSTPLSAQEPQRAVPPRARPLASRAAFGFGTGIGLGITLGALAWLSDQLEYPYSALIPANMIGAWLGLGFILGASAKTVPTGALRGLVGLLSAVGAYYLLISLSEAGFRLIGAPHAATTWGAVGVIAGPIFGAAGGAWRHWQGTGRALAVAVLAASLIAEGVVFGELRLVDIGGILLLVEVAIGLAVPYALLRPGERLIGYVATGLLALAIGLAIEPVFVLVRSVADRF